MVIIIESKVRHVMMGMIQITKVVYLTALVRLMAGTVQEVTIPSQTRVLSSAMTATSPSMKSVKIATQS